MKKEILDFLTQKAQDEMLDAAFHAGASKAHLEAAAFVEGLPEQSPPSSQPSPNEKQPRQEFSSGRSKTQRPIYELLRRSDRPMSLEEIIGALRRDGHDVIPATARNVLNNGVRLGVFERVGTRYQIAKSPPSHDNDYREAM